jgi:hypothetical protein
VGANAGVAIADRRGHLGVGRSPLALAGGSKGDAQSVLGQAGADQSLSRQAAQEVAGLLLEILGAFPRLAVRPQGYVAILGPDLETGEVGLQLGRHRQPMVPLVVLPVRHAEAHAVVRIGLVVGPLHRDGALAAIAEIASI